MYYSRLKKTTLYEIQTEYIADLIKVPENQINMI